jgi:hypothetical protein
VAHAAVPSGIPNVLVLYRVVEQRREALIAVPDGDYALIFAVVMRSG